MKRRRLRGDENVSSKSTLKGSLVFHDYSINWTGTNGFEVKIENERFTAVCTRCRYNLKSGHFMFQFCLQSWTKIVETIYQN